ncbi:uncharacterized protein GLRG_00369 [Colletotrichum graminicola M1.001]|uniref:Uncharacterized protein n=1 Tax=Colletotrichum graminicola (strain M1.001 / M2 / FGSC 10212) TaxID=645133 RepID=E3Q2C4_COLGM|nr:uncharacterized protein GLRG_00369 [Colletotrichum graminicola M1.001]EFQ25225.1 hypothetical protein GLRG_00369 [Colletotrichum graminicola M1.001]
MCALRSTEGSDLDHIATCLQDLAWSAFPPSTSSGKSPCEALGLVPLCIPYRRRPRSMSSTGSIAGEASPSVYRSRYPQTLNIPRIIEPSVAHRSAGSHRNKRRTRTQSPGSAIPSPTMTQRSVSDMHPLSAGCSSESQMGSASPSYDDGASSRRTSRRHGGKLLEDWENDKPPFDLYDEPIGFRTQNANKRILNRLTVFIQVSQYYNSPTPHPGHRHIQAITS